MLSRATENQELGPLIQELLKNLEKDIKTHDTKKETGFNPLFIYSIEKVEKILGNIIDLLERSNKKDSNIIHRFRSFKHTCYLYKHRSKPAKVKTLSLEDYSFDIKTFYSSIVNRFDRLH